MLLIPNALCYSQYKCNCVCAVTKFFYPQKNFSQFLRVTCTCSCTSAGNAQAQLHFRDDQQRVFGISNICNCKVPNLKFGENLRTSSHKGSPKLVRTYLTCFLWTWMHLIYRLIFQRFSWAGPRGRGREWATLGVHPLSWLLSNNRLEEVCGTLTKGTFSSLLLLSNQDKLRMYP